MSGEMSSTRVSTEMEMDCCFSAAVRSDSTMSLVGGFYLISLGFNSGINLLDRTALICGSSLELTGWNLGCASESGAAPGCT